MRVRFIKKIAYVLSVINQAEYRLTMKSFISFFIISSMNVISATSLSKIQSSFLSVCRTLLKWWWSFSISSNSIKITVFMLILKWFHASLWDAFWRESIERWWLSITCKRNSVLTKWSSKRLYNLVIALTNLYHLWILRKLTFRVLERLVLFVDREHILKI